MIRKIDESFMRLALSLAKKRKGYTHPNPTVGAVVVKNGKILGLGYHERAGMPHAEVVALNQAGKEAKGSTLYVTLEPCTHYGRTPPCTNAIIESGVKRVVVATEDPNPVVSGKGIEKLKKAGIEVEVGILREEAKEINEDFFTYVSLKRPYITLKWAQTIDGKLATKSGKSKWITSYESRKVAHLLRREATAVLVGVGTVMADDPELTVRYIPTEKQPVRVILDPELKIPKKAKVLNDGKAKTVIITKKKPEGNYGNAEVITTENFSLENILNLLYQREIMHILVEGGAYTLSSFIKAGLYDRVCVFIAPKLMGEGKSIMDLGVESPDELTRLKLKETKRIGEDVLLIFKRA